MRNRNFPILAGAVVFGLLAGVMFSAANITGPRTVRLPNLIVKDSLGNFVGEVITVNLNGQPTILLEDGNTPIAADVRTDGLVVKQGTQTYYESTGCTGTVYLDNPANLGPTQFNALLGVSYSIGPGNILYRGEGPTFDIEVHSYWNSHPDFLGCTDSTFMTTLVVGTSRGDLDDFFTPPYHLE